MAHVFFSCAHADEARIYPFHARLQAVTGHHIWIDKVGLRQGIEWENALHRAVTTSYGVVFAVTAAFLESKCIREKEIHWAVAHFRTRQGPLLLPHWFDTRQFHLMCGRVRRSRDRALASEIYAEYYERLD